MNAATLQNRPALSVTPLSSEPSRTPLDNATIAAEPSRQRSGMLHFPTATQTNAIRGVPAMIRGVPAMIRGVPAMIRGVPAMIWGVAAMIWGVPAIIRGVPTMIRGVPTMIRGVPAIKQDEMPANDLKYNHNETRWFFNHAVTNST